mgnify:CR=1 FL=1
MAKAGITTNDRRSPGRQTVEAALDLAARMPHLLLEARRVAASVAGVHGRRRAGPGETFWQFRSLGPGEAANRIDWRRSGREGKLFVREREWEASHAVWLWIDRSASMGFRSPLARAAKVERALVAGLALAEVMVEAGERVGHLGLTPAAAARNIVERLAEAITADPAGLAADLPVARPLAPLSEAIIVTDALERAELWGERLAALAARGARGHLLLIVDPIEETFPFAGQAELHDLEDGLELRVGDAAAWRAAYLDRLKAHRAALVEHCRRLGWTFTLHHTDHPASEAVLRVANLIAAARGRM